MRTYNILDRIPNTTPEYNERKQAACEWYTKLRFGVVSDDGVIPEQTVLARCNGRSPADVLDLMAIELSMLVFSDLRVVKTRYFWVVRDSHNQMVEWTENAGEAYQYILDRRVPRLL